ncbi:hypothetical protein Mgra_00007014 [Meloidogyne graminicola]|nr:hypothetical protein Mgra_00007014 [Meloidogyne graminicola]
MSEPNPKDLPKDESDIICQLEKLSKHFEEVSRNKDKENKEEKQEILSFMFNHFIKQEKNFKTFLVDQQKFLSQMANQMEQSNKKFFEQMTLSNALTLQKLKILINKDDPSTDETGESMGTSSFGVAGSSSCISLAKGIQREETPSFMDLMSSDKLKNQQPSKIPIPRNYCYTCQKDYKYSSTYKRHLCSPKHQRVEEAKRMLLEDKQVSESGGEPSPVKSIGEDQPSTSKMD